MTSKGIQVAAFALVISFVGCGSDGFSLPEKGELEQLLDLPPGSFELIGGLKSEPENSAQHSTIWVVSSEMPLPIPEKRDSVRKNARRRVQESRRSDGRSVVSTNPCPLSAVESMMAACHVEEDNWPKWKTERAESFQWNSDDQHVCIREAATESGWLTVVEWIGTGPGTRSNK